MFTVNYSSSLNLHKKQRNNKAGQLSNFQSTAGNSQIIDLRPGSCSSG